MTIQPPLPGFATQASTDFSPATDLLTYPAVPGATLARHGRLIGRAGEDFTSSMLRRYGFMLFDLDDHSSDKAFCVGDVVVGLQIKTVTRPDAGGTWRVQVRRGCSRGSGRRGYPMTGFDLLAIAVLPENVVFFSANRTQCHSIRSCEIARLRADPLASLDEALCALGLDLGLGAPMV